MAYAYSRNLVSGAYKTLKAAKVPPAFARTIGITVDHRRVNRSVPTFTANVERLQAYKSKLILFPRKAKKPKKGDSSAEELATATQTSVLTTFPIAPYAPAVTERKITQEEKDATSRFTQLRVARTNKRQAGKRAKRAAEKAETEAATKK